MRCPGCGVEASNYPPSLDDGERSGSSCQCRGCRTWRQGHPLPTCGDDDWWCQGCLNRKVGAARAGAS